MSKSKIPEHLRVIVGDRFEYGDGKGVWEVMDTRPGGVVCLMDRAHSIQGDRYQRDIRSALERGTYKRLPPPQPQAATKDKEE